MLVANPVGMASAHKNRTSLHLLDDRPLLVTGRGFEVRERVRLRTSIAGERISKVVVASRLGRFTVQLAAHAECRPFVVYAEGRAGSRATLRRIQIPPPCGPPIAP